MKKKALLTSLILLLTISMFAQRGRDQGWNREQQAIKNVIQTAYIDGLHNNGSVQEIMAGFHPGFNLLGINENKLTKYPIYSWIQDFKIRKERNSRPMREEAKMVCEYESIDVTGNAAQAKIKLYKDQRLIFTDYLQLYKFDEGWRIVSKIYYRH